MDEIVKEFLVESTESLDRLDRDLLALENDSTSAATIASIFRTMHTLKGTSGFLAFKKLESLAHVAENLLVQVRDGALAVNQEITSALLATNDAVRTMLGSIERAGNDGDNDYRDLIGRLAGLQIEDSAATASPAASRPRVEAKPATPAVEAPQAILPQETSTPSVRTAATAAANPEPAPDKESRAPAGEAIAQERTESAIADGETATRSVGKVAETSIRVDVELLERLMTLVGELVLARNQVLQFSASKDDSAFQQTTQRLNLVTTELQENVMKTRMQPIGNVWSKFPRVVRDLAIACQKKVRIEMEGKETELDRSLLEAIKDPLTHIVRNSIDHGIESPADRKAAGKDEEGCLRLRASHEGGQVNLEISDDGRGIDLERVKAKAVQQGLVTAEQAAKMGDREATNLIFRPGFSTAAQVTNISGRGVGMDVVKSNIEKIGGTVDIQSKLGEGTLLRIKIPLTLAIIPALTVLCDGDRYAIPQVSLVELVRLEGDDAQKGIENLHGSLVHRLRGNLLPLVFLSDELGNRARRDPRDVIASIGEQVNIVVLHADGRHFGLVVDEIQDTEEIVVKPLGKHIKGINRFAGTTIMGDGRVALILDVRGIAHCASLIGQDAQERDKAAAKSAARGDEETRSLLLLQSGASARLAIPLSQVSRLEEFKREDVERIGGVMVVQYRGDIMPLVEVASLLPSHTADAVDAANRPSVIQVVVHTRNGRSVGLAVERILDILQEEVQVHREATREGIKETIVVQGKVTEVIDVDWVVSSTAHVFRGMVTNGQGS
jgi:two-component system chemotaxis sensor kinase CheA